MDTVTIQKYQKFRVFAPTKFCHPAGDLGAFFPGDGAFGPNPKFSACSESSRHDALNDVFMRRKPPSSSQYLGGGGSWGKGNLPPQVNVILAACEE